MFTDAVQKPIFGSLYYVLSIPTKFYYSCGNITKQKNVGFAKHSISSL